jgi:hypothetical protein
MANKTRRKNKSCRNSRKRGGGPTVYYKISGQPLAPITHNNNIRTYGNLRRYHRLLKEKLLTGHDNSNLIRNKNIVEVVDFLTTPEVFRRMLDDKSQDFGMISRERRKFAVSLNGGPPPYIFGNISGDDKDLLNLFSSHYGFPIEFEESFFTFYDRDAANLLLELFNDQGIFTDVDSISELYRKYSSHHFEIPPNENFMHFIHILFGEIDGYEGRPSASTHVRNVSVNFMTLPEHIQTIIAIFYSIYS